MDVLDEAATSLAARAICRELYRQGGSAPPDDWVLLEEQAELGRVALMALIAAGYTVIPPVSGTVNG